MAAELQISMFLTAKEFMTTGQAPFAQGAKGFLTHDGMNLSQTLTLASAAGLNVFDFGYGTVTMSAGAGSINLAACPGIGGATKDFTTKKLRFAAFRAKSANANNITIAKGASNGFTGFGASFSLTIPPGKQCILMSDVTAISSTVRLFDITGTLAQQLEFLLAFGDN